MSYVLRVEQLKKTFKKDWPSSVKTEVLKGLDFSIQKGTVTGFLGTNGSGKTTTMKCMLGLIPFEDGKISFFDGKPLGADILKRVGFLPEQPYFYDRLTGEELLVFYGQLSDSVNSAELRSRARALLKKLHLYDAKDRRIKDYSKGMLQKVGVAQALIHHPEFVILDEPMAGLDPDGRLCVAELIRELYQKGTTVFFSSHLLYDVERLCSHLVVLKDGQSVYSGSVQGLLDQMKRQQREIVYMDQGKKHSLYVKTLQQCQEQLDTLRKKGCDIVKVEVDKRTLEKAFVKIS